MKLRPALADSEPCLGTSCMELNLIFCPCPRPWAVVFLSLARLQDLQERHEQIGDVRGKGLLVGIELVEDREKKTPADTLAMAVSDECIRRGLSMNIVRSVGGLLNCFRMAPPLSVTEQEIDIAVEIIDDALAGRNLMAGALFSNASRWAFLRAKRGDNRGSRWDDRA